MLGPLIDVTFIIVFNYTAKSLFVTLSDRLLLVTSALEWCGAGGISDSTILYYIFQTSAKIFISSLNFCDQIKLFHKCQLTGLNEFCSRIWYIANDGFSFYMRTYGFSEVVIESMIFLGCVIRCILFLLLVSLIERNSIVVECKF